MTRKILRFLGSRYGIAAIMLLLVIVVVGIARANGGSDQDTTVGDSDSDIGTEDDGEPNDGVYSEPADEKPTLPDEAVNNATDFAEEYIDTDRSADAWRTAWSDNATQRLKDQLKGVGPETVPINEIRDEPSVEGQTVRFPTDAGLLILRMTEQDGVWLVDGIDLDKT